MPAVTADMCRGMLPHGNDKTYSPKKTGWEVRRYFVFAIRYLSVAMFCIGVPPERKTV